MNPIKPTILAQAIRTALHQMREQAELEHYRAQLREALGIR